MNRLYYGDCVSIMNSLPAACVDLVYLDPPFNSNREYGSIYKDETGMPLPDQIEAFNDLWSLDDDREKAIREMPIRFEHADVDSNVTQFWQYWVKALRKTNPRLLAYLSYMTERLLPLKSIVKPTGSIYLHCDPTASHYIKIMMDAIFEHGSFRNEIIWKRNTSHNSGRQFGRVHDVILFYTMSKNWTWNRTYSDSFSDEQLARFRSDPDGRMYKGENLTAARPNSESGKFEWRGSKPGPSRGWAYTEEELERLWDAGRILRKRDGSPRLDGLKVYLDDLDGPQTQSVWTDVPRIANTSSERLGYATQKPLKLLKRIIEASSNPGDVVLDPFCGCATTLEAAHHLGRRWIGIDIAIHAIKRVAKIRLEDRLGLQEGVDFTIEGVPETREGAVDLWERDKHHFQKWAVEQVDGFVTSRKSNDGGVDGRLYFSLPDRRELSSMLIEVKGGRNVGISAVRNLRGVLERENAPMAGLIVMDDPGERKRRNFLGEMAQAGDMDVLGVAYPRMQMLTVDEILEGKRFLTPSIAKGRTREAQQSLPLG